MSSPNLYPTHDKLVSRCEKERELGQRGQAIWFYGLSGSGKSTISQSLDRLLHAEGRLTKVLDGDNVRGGLNSDLGFSDQDRMENIRRVAETAKLFVEGGIITLASFITPTRAQRDLAREIIGAPDLTLVYTRASLAVCRQRDPKGLYAKVDEGKVSQFTGKDSEFEEPLAESPDIIVDTETHDLAACVALAKSLLNRGA